MSPVSASCPACGAAIVFGVDTSLVAVCRHCDSIVGRGDQKLEDLGKAGRLTETGAVLEAELVGRFDGRRFQLTGRTQLRHEAGGTWDEWYAHFDDGRWGWLAEAQGRYYLTFESKKPPQAKFDTIVLGKAVAGVPGILVAAEKGVATAIGAEGELPFRLEPGARYRFADLAGSSGDFATIDFSEDPPKLFVGKEVTLQEIGITPKKTAPKREVKAVAVNCPNCGAPLPLKAPDKTERVACRACSSLLDCKQGELKFLQTLKQPEMKMHVPLGAKGTLGGIEWLVIGFCRRSVTYQGVKYPWDEYLLYSPAQGFRWLVQSDGHWNFGGNVSVAEVELGAYGKSARYKGDSYRLFQDGGPRVDGVYGEFYWQINVGDTSKSADFIHPPFMLSKEESTYQGGAEINWTRLEYLSREDVAKAFNLKAAELPSPDGVAPNQMFPHKPIFKLWRRFSAALAGLWLLIAITSGDRELFKKDLTLDPLASNEQTAVFFSEPFEAKGGANVEVTVKSPVQNSWISVQGDLINEDTGMVQDFDAPIEYYSGTDDGESWSEGSTSKSQAFAGLPPGKYTLRVEAAWERFSEPATVSVEVREDVAQFGDFFLAFLGLSVIPFLTLIRNYTFDVRRWKNSDYSPYQSSDDDDD